MYLMLTFVAVFALVYSAVAGRLEKTPFNGPFVYVGFGLAFGPLGFGVFSGEVDSSTLRLLAELTLAILLFTDAAAADRSVLKNISMVPTRMLLIGLPLVIILGFLIGMLIFPQMPLLELAILATILAPTDAALGKAVISNPEVPVEIRESLKAESGINDGICVPVLLAFVAMLAKTEEPSSPASLLINFFITEIGIGLAVGLILTAVSVKFLDFCYKSGWITGYWLQIPMPMLALACFGAAQYLHGSGFIAAFAGGLLYGAIGTKDNHELVESSETIGELTAMLTWIAFGAAVVGQSIGYFGWEMIIYAVLSLTIIRMVPIYLSLLGLEIGSPTKLFLGWFGPRGLASIVFVIIVLDSQLQNAGIITMTVCCTVILSVVAHGLSATPLASLIAKNSRNA